MQRNCSSILGSVLCFTPICRRKICQRSPRLGDTSHKRPCRTRRRGSQIRRTTAATVWSQRHWSNGVPIRHGRSRWPGYDAELAPAPMAQEPGRCCRRGAADATRAERAICVRSAVHAAAGGAAMSPEDADKRKRVRLEQASVNLEEVFQQAPLFTLPMFTIGSARQATK